MLKQNLVRLLHRFHVRNRTHDPSLKHPLFPNLIGLLRNRRWSEFRLVFSNLPADERHVILSGIAESSVAADEFAFWAGHDPSLGSLVQGTALISHAWRARTQLAGKYVTQDAARGFADHLWRGRSRFGRHSMSDPPQ